MAVMEFRNIERAYKANEKVLDGISFDVQPGEVVGLLGRNGAGKTTLIRLAMGMIAPQHGTVRLFGLDPREEPVAVKRRVGYVSEDQALPGFLRIDDVLELHRRLFPTWDDLMARGLAQRYGLDLSAKIKTLSKGQARQVALLGAVSHKPELLILDEPAGGLDPAARRDFLETSIQLLNDAGTTILFSSHYMADVERMAGRVVMIDRGRVLLDDQLDALQEDLTLVVVPHADGAEALLAAQRDCLAVRDRIEGLHAVFRGGERGVGERVAGLGLGSCPCTSLSLEETFIELVEGRS
jgi:ABC-2 type transport system ATP-binding protein